MKNISIGAWAFVAAAIAVAMSAFSLHAGRRPAGALPAGKGGNPAQLEMRLDTLASQLADLQRNVKKIQSLAPPGRSFGQGDSAGGEAPGSLEARLSQLEQIVEASGLARLMTDGHWNADVLKRVNDQYRTADKVKVRQKSLMTKNSDYHRFDADRYGKTLEDLYETALLGKSREASAAEIAAANQALETMMRDYPESYATGMLIAEEALSAAMEMNAGEAEEYYRDLRGSGKFKDIVTDSGIEAVPAIQSYLVREYIQAGRTDEANALIQDMEENFADSIVPERTQPGSEPTFKTAAETASNLRQMLKSFESGMMGPRGPGP
ncbi:MAG: hypothetical protein AB7V14_10805 [Kiritimatiellia bacterium]